MHYISLHLFFGKLNNSVFSYSEPIMKTCTVVSFCYAKSIHSAYTAQLSTHKPLLLPTCTHYAPPLARDEKDLRASVSQEAVVVRGF